MLFKSNGKFLLTGEYLVLKGATALALPLKKGQSLEAEVLDSNDNLIYWDAFYKSTDDYKDAESQCRKDAESQCRKVAKSESTVNANNLLQSSEFRVQSSEFKEKPHLYTKGGEKQYKDYEKNSAFKLNIKRRLFFNIVKNLFFSFW